ncbi:hypothetical protein, partial [Aeromonas hydrophila]|uniref:hypothetical protein n=1 Tax=Aeromonas hydrophila TaxID=644 RepID=UPI001C30DC66
MGCKLVLRFPLVGEQSNFEDVTVNVQGEFECVAKAERLGESLAWDNAITTIDGHILHDDVVTVRDQLQLLDRIACDVLNQAPADTMLAAVRK